MKYNIRQMQIRSKLKNLCVKCGNILDHRASLKSGLDSLKLIQSRKSHLIGLPRNWCKNPGTLVWPLETKNNCSTRSSQNILINFVALTWQTTNLNYALICVRISAQFGKCVDLAIIMAENRNQIVDSDSPPPPPKFWPSYLFDCGFVRLKYRISFRGKKHVFPFNLP